MALILVVTVLLTFLLIRKVLSWVPLFHWLEFICVTLFVLSIGAHLFNGYSSAYPSLELTEKYLPYLTVHDQFVVLYPLLFLWVLQLVRRKKPWPLCLLAALIWHFGYLVLIFVDVDLGVLRIQGSYWTPVLITTLYNAVFIVTALLFLKFIHSIIRNEKQV